MINKLLSFSPALKLNHFRNRTTVLSIIWRSMCSQGNTCDILLDHTHVNVTFR